MAEFDRVGNSDNFNFMGVPSLLQVCEMCSQATRKKMECLHSDVLLHIYSKSLNVRLPVCPVNINKILISIKL